MNSQKEKQYGMAKTLTREQMLEDVRKFLLPVAQDALNDFIEGDAEAKLSLDRIFELVAEPKDDDLINHWCEFVSEDFFKANCLVDEVLFLKGNGTEKVWVASQH